MHDIIDMLKQVAVPASWLAIPVGLWCAIDSWLLAPRRLIEKGAHAVTDPPVTRVAYAVLPWLVAAVVLRLVTAETLDFSLVLLLLSVATGIVWLLDHLFFRKKREQAMMKGVGGEMALPEPGTVDYARSFFPVAFIVLIVRAFIFEPFRIPSDSMMPTLLDGDFIVVNKFSYGLRWPVINQKFLDIGLPKRGDVVVFRHPPHPNVNYIKRLVGLPGDLIEVHDDRLVVNGETIPLQEVGDYNDGCYEGLKLYTETIGEHTHQVMSCRSEVGLMPGNRFVDPGSTGLPVCDRKKTRADVGSWVCRATPAGSGRDRGDHQFEIVPDGYYLMIGDNRDNSDDSRGWGLVPDQNLVGKATRIWFNFDLQRGSVVNWSRIGDSIP